ESVRRRFNYAICFERLSANQRAAIWQNLIERRHLGHLIPADQITTYARRYETNAGGIALLLDNLSRLSPAPEEVAPLIERLMAPHCRLLELSTTPALLPAEDYSLDGLNVQGPISPADLLSAAQNALDPVFRASSTLPARMTLLLFGPPGTGKTEFVKFLAQALGRPILLKRGSDLLSKFVGDTEQAIADAFRQAQQENAILFFDEVDGLLQNRTLANASWEVTQVNEFLQQMEHYTGLLVAATNFRTNLDPAMMRRFTFKLEFDYLTAAGKRAFFERTFQSPLTPAQAAELDAIHPLAPGDFQTVRQALRYLASSPSNADRLAALRNECALKTEPHASPIGF
ncbi:MAG: AAA family ATPase, partial [Candidatus Spyradenecus sp.]